ncbi:CapA family protein [Nannocystis sp.]|uniref:CapA family protein n=1 Tax=Nannocystis sp. TaxID=1962667 RepID=UPI0025D6D551|nr:CapA family protein [Nannocystis sp.]MBK7826910.1 CapA family protein [Nannocystis sp.]
MSARRVGPFARAALVSLVAAAGACSGPASAVLPPPRVSSQAPAPAAPPAELTPQPAPSDLSQKTATAPADPQPETAAPDDLSPQTAKRPAPTTPLELVFVGDIILGKYRLDAYAPLFAADADPFAAVADLLKADAAIANLETPLMHTRPERSPIYIGSRFGADKQAARALVGRFAALGVANNHALDLLTAGLEQTPAVLRELGLTPVGEARKTGDVVQVATLERGGWRVALLAATTWLNRSPAPGDPALAVFKTGEMPRRLLPAVRSARATHDLVVVLLHWGQEYSEGPDHAQRAAARRLLAGGADLVIGHHPHVLQGLERHEHGLIAYSLGNFLFANTDERSRESGVLRVRYLPGQRCPERASFHPVWLGEAPGFTPAPAPAAQATQIAKHMQARSKLLRTPLTRDGDALVLSGWSCPVEPIPKDM